NRLRRTRCPGLPVKQATQRWAAYLDASACAWLAGDVLLHTDFNPLNVLIAPQATWIVDWAWPTRGAAFIDPACFLLRLMANGHPPPAPNVGPRNAPDGARPHRLPSTRSPPPAPGCSPRSPATTPSHGNSNSPAPPASG